MDGDLKIILGTIGYYRDIRKRDVKNARRFEIEAIDAYTRGDTCMGDSYMEKLSEIYSNIDRESNEIKNALSKLVQDDN
jgi:hypothetical protein